MHPNMFEIFRKALGIALFMALLGCAPLASDSNRAAHLDLSSPSDAELGATLIARIDKLLNEPELTPASIERTLGITLVEVGRLEYGSRAEPKNPPAWIRNKSMYFSKGGKGIGGRGIPNVLDIPIDKAKLCLKLADVKHIFQEPLQFVPVVTHYTSDPDLFGTHLRIKRATPSGREVFVTFLVLPEPSNCMTQIRIHFWRKNFDE
jgi:hypothetical protein